MRGKVSCELAWPERDSDKRVEGGREGERRRKKRPAPEYADGMHFDQEVPVDESLLAALKKKREEVAREVGNVPRYQIFSDETLKAFARLKPADFTAARRIRGVGDFKAERYLNQFLGVISQYSDHVP